MAAATMQVGIRVYGIYLAQAICYVSLALGINEVTAYRAAMAAVWVRIKIGRHTTWHKLSAYSKNVPRGT